MGDSAPELYRRAKDLFNDGKLEESLTCCNKLFKETSGFADARNMAGLIFHEKGDYESAVKCFEEALRQNPNYSEASLNLTLTYSAMGKDEEAKKVLNTAKTAAKNEPGNVPSFEKGRLANMHAEMGDIYEHLGLIDSAIDEYKKALKLRPDFVDVRTKIGIVLRDGGEIEKAVKEFLIAKNNNTTYASVLINLGLAYYSQGKLDLAQTEWEAVKKENPKYRLAQMYLNLLNKID